MSEQSVTPTVDDYVTAIGQSRMAAALEVGPTAISHMKATGLIGSRHYLRMRALCVRLGMAPPPDALFSFTPADSVDHPIAGAQG